MINQPQDMINQPQDSTSTITAPFASEITARFRGLLSLLLIGLLLLPGCSGGQAAKRQITLNNMKIIGLGMMTYQDSRGRFPAPAGLPLPPGGEAPGEATGAGAEEEANPYSNGRGLSWRVHLLPFVEQQALYEQFHLDEPWDSPHNKALMDQMPEVYKSLGVQLPAGQTVMLLVTGPGTAFADGRGPGWDDIPDGHSSTLMLVEADAELAQPWTKPGDWTFDPANPLKGLGALRGGEWLAVFFDSHARSFGTDLPSETAAAIMTNAGEEIVELP